MIIEIALWFVFCSFSLGLLGVDFVLMRKASFKPWGLKMKNDYNPNVSIIVPTYNESDVVAFKLQNLSLLEHPKDLTQIVVIDGKSDDDTAEIVHAFAKSHPEMNVEVIIEGERKGKSAALNTALRHCNGDIVIVSDADCFWPSDILQKALPFFADPDVGAVSGPKALLNSESSRVAKGEGRYLDSMNLIKLGESKTGSTLLFEGGFSAYKKEVLDSFDPYHTGSDDCGTVISVIEKKSRAILVPEARFYTTFPNQWAEKLGMKTRRANQLVRLYWKYLVLLANQSIRSNSRTVVTNVLIYLFGPIFFVLFLAVTVMLFVEFPLLIASLLLFFVPRIGNFLAEASQGFLFLFFGLWTVALKRNFLVWKKPADRHLFTEDMLKRCGLV
jgi:cellulose synthase/poly-beta-1,6-N-acetylglucosamine synthase-like glycosyltransferase